MTTRTMVRTAAGCAAGGAALAVLGYATIAGAAWARYGRPPRARTPEEQDPLLDRFMPFYDIVERHHIQVEAPAEVTFKAARDLRMDGSCVARAMFKGRELMLGAKPAPPPTGGMLDAMVSIGWGILADHPDREIVLGAVTRPWEPNPVFREVLSSEFAAFEEPGFVKIALTLRADPIGETQSIFRTETRAVATDARARSQFRRYWALVSPGVALIRLSMLGPIKADAERRVLADALVAQH